MRKNFGGFVSCMRTERSYSPGGFLKNATFTPTVADLDTRG